MICSCSPGTFHQCKNGKISIYTVPELVSELDVCVNAPNYPLFWFDI